MCRSNSKAFALMELLVVISVIAVLMAILVPALNISRSQAKQIVCKNNLQQLIIANGGYTNDNAGYFVPAALDILAENRHRWYGTRNDTNSPFDTARGPLASYLAHKTIGCPQRPRFTKQAPSQLSFLDYEEGCGGYGYNMIYLGSRIWLDGYEDQSCKSTANSGEVRRPTQTLVFTDTAMAKLKNGRLCCTEYSFAEPRYFVIKGTPDTASWDPSPSIQFRHRRTASIGWADGHISSEKMAKYDRTNFDGVKPANFNIGWFEPMDNTPFDLN